MDHRLAQFEGESKLKLAMYHGYELSGSGSNEYTRYLARTLAEQGHEIVLICREPHPEAFEFIGRAVSYSASGEPTEVFMRPVANGLRVTLHRLPETSCHPVFVKDKQRPGNVKAFPEMTDAELAEYHEAMAATVSQVLDDERPELLHVNHLVYQPQVALDACRETATPFYIVPHGSAIEYTVKQDPRFHSAARKALEQCAGVVWITGEVRRRVCRLFPERREQILAKSREVGVGTDTSLFEPLDPEDRPRAIEELKTLHVRGGKTPALRIELRHRLDEGDLDAVRDYWDAYDHNLPDDDLPATLDRIPLDRDLLIFVGALTYGKGVQSLIAALPGILERRPDTHLVLVGSGTFREVLEALVHALDTDNPRLFDAVVEAGRDLERGPMTGPLEDLRSYAARPEDRERLSRYGRGLADRIHFLGRLDHSMLRCIFPCFRLAVFPSIVHEASPLVFYESMANGVLPIGSDHSGLHEGIEGLRPNLPATIGERIGLPVEPRDRVGGMVLRIAELLDEPLLREIGSELRRIVVAHHDWHAIAEQLTTAVSTWAQETSVS